MDEAAADAAGLTCPVCLEQITDCHITPCGHCFCGPCIRESLDRRAFCPICQREASPDRLVKNSPFDNLAQLLLEEREKAAQRHFEGLVDAAKDAGGAAGAESCPDIQAVFQKHVRRTLVAFEDYAERLRAEHQRKVTALELRFSQRLAPGLSLEHLLKAPPLAVDPDSPSDPEPAEAWAAGHRIALEFVEQRGRLQAQLEQSLRLLAEAFDGFLGRIPSSPFLLPIRLKLQLPGRLPHPVLADLQSTDYLADVLPILKQQTAELGANAVVDFGDDLRFEVIQALAAAEVGSADEQKEDARVFSLAEAREIAISELQLQPGSSVLIFGDSIRLEGDKPQSCFSLVFEKDAGMRVDYFRCVGCGFNWICRTCAEHCHKGHELKMFMANHAPSFASCYCPKRKTCVIKNPKNP